MRRLRRIIASMAKAPTGRHTGALIVYATVFCGLLLPKLFPAQPRRILSNSPADGAIFLWSLGWWPHAIASGQFLPYTHVVFAPGGTNLAWTTSIPVASILLWPITHAFGVFASFNVLSLIAPITAGWMTYLLVFRVTGRWWPSLAAGLLFALSPLEMTEVAIGHLNLSLTALIPLAAYLVVREIEGSLSAPLFVALLGVVLAAELGLSTEVFLATTLFGCIALLFAYLWDGERRPALRRCAGLVGLSYVAAGFLAAPLLYVAVARPHPSGVASAGTVTPLSGVRTYFGSGPSHAVLPHMPGRLSSSAVILLAVPLFAILLQLAWRRRGEPIFRALAATALVALVFSLGIVVVGTTVIPTPWTLMRHLPLLTLVRPQRLTMFAWLIAAVGLGVWLSERPPSWGRWSAGALALAAMLPAVMVGPWTSVIPTTPALLAEPQLYLPRGANVAVVAAAGSPFDDLAFPTVWQVESDFSFRLANAYVGSFGPSLPDAASRFVFAQPLRSGQSSAALAWLRRAGAAAVLVMRPTPAAVRSVQELLETEPVRVDGLALFLVPST